MQVYRDLRIVTARPSSVDEEQVPHRMFGHVDGAESYSVGRWVCDVASVLADIKASARLAIVVGGTGLYFKALLEGLSPIPTIPAAIRDHWRAEAVSQPVAALHAALAQRDHIMAARLEAGDTQRIVRALEVWDATGRSLADWQGQAGALLLAPDQIAARYVVTPDRETLYARCNARFDQMLAAGAADEVAHLMARKLPTTCPVMRAIGVPELAAVARGEMDVATARETAQQATRRYAKRQMTWLRGNMMSWQWGQTEDLQINAHHMFANRNA